MSSNQRITFLKQIKSPQQILVELPIQPEQEEVVLQTRREIESVLEGKSNKLIVVVGPCSIHDPQAALEYAKFLKTQIDQYSSNLILVMRTYFSKPRTTVGWKGFINDPKLDNSCQIDLGLYLARKLLLDILSIGVPCAMEQLDTILPQYFNDLLSWSAIGARTTESQVHRELASGISTPIGFKNNTDGNTLVAINAIKSSQREHNFLGCNMDGNICAIQTRGNPYGHLILRGSRKGTNYQTHHIKEITKNMLEHQVNPNLIIDFSHDNSLKDYQNQIYVARDVGQQIAVGNKNIKGVMIESNLIEGKQKITDVPLVYGKSITDSCINLNTTKNILDMLAGYQIRREKIIEGN